MKPILLVEDNVDDAFFMRRALRRAEVANPLVVIENGKSALDYLRKSLMTPDAEHPLPELVFLDVNLPEKSGLEILRWIREQPKLKTLAVVVLTSSDVTIDNERALHHGATSILVKPATAAKLASLKTDLGLSSEPEL